MFDTQRWQTRLDESRTARRVPGATLAVWEADRLHELASGVLNRSTDVEATPDSLFLAGSIAKTYTATAIFVLADRGLLDVDRPVIELLPTFSTADPDATKRITVRQLLSHTSGLTCDFVLDTGRGDDCVQRYVEAAADVALDCPPGSAISYSSVGYAVLGRIVEVSTGSTWDEAIAELIVRPLGLQQTVTLPEDALRFRVAMGHQGGDGADWPQPADVWDLMPRSAGPYGRVIVSAGDIVRFAAMHLRGGLAPDGTRVLSEDSVAAMQRREVDTVDRWTFHADGWGLGWALSDVEGTSCFGHDGSAVTQQSWLRVVPRAGVAVALMANCDQAAGLYEDLIPDLLRDLADAELPPSFTVPDTPVDADLRPWVGLYRRAGVAMTVSEDGGSKRLRYEFVDGMAGLSPPLEGDLVPVTDRIFAAVDVFGPEPLPVIFGELPDGTVTATVSMRVTPRVNG